MSGGLLQAGPVTGPGYYDFDAETYHADPAPKPSGSSSVLAMLIAENAQLAKEAHPRLATPPEPTDDEEEEEAEADDKKFDTGSVAHELLLGKGRGIAVIDAKDWRTKKAKEARKEAKAEGLQPCLAATYRNAERMVAAAREQLEWDSENGDAFTNGRAETCVFWQEPLKPGKMWMRAMLDWQMEDRRRVYDYKTFKRGADPEQFHRWLIGSGKDIQDPFYSRGVAALEGCDWHDVTFRFVVQDADPPFQLAVVELVEEVEPQGGRLWSYDRSQWALEHWAACAATGVYRGFIPRTYPVSAPTWAQTQWELRKQLILSGEQMMLEDGQPAAILP